MSRATWTGRRGAPRWGASPWGTALALTAALAGCKIENTFVPGHQTDTFFQVEVDQVDILFVVDNSNSMIEEQAALAAGFQAFTENLEDANSDFHIAVVTTSQESDDPTRGFMIGSPPFLTSDDDYVSKFQDRVSIGINGSDKEKGLEAAVHALSPALLANQNAGFLRPDANLLVIVVSDEEDCSDDGFLDGYESSACYQIRDLLTPVPTLVARLQKTKTNGERVQIGGIVGPFDGTCVDAYPGRRYAQAALSTGGLLGRICDADMANVLYDLGLNATGILDQFKLSRPADITSLIVTVDDVEVPSDATNGYTYIPEYWTIQFHGGAIPARGATIVVDYDISPYVDDGPVATTRPQ
ncbi:MAG: vWA domain-containing protein [Myxococcota bacterium]